MPVKDQAAYMREYRKRRKLQARGLETAEDVELTIDVAGISTAYRAKDDIAMVDVLVRRIVFLEGEIARLKRELAQRPGTTIRASGDGVQIVSAETRRARQAVIDAALAKVNRTARK